MAIQASRNKYNSSIKQWNLINIKKKFFKTMENTSELNVKYKIFPTQYSSNYQLITVKKHP